MRHKNRRSELNRFTGWEEATLKSLVRNLILHESIKTTLRRAKLVRPLAEKLISLAKSNTLSAKREAFKVLGDHKLVAMFFNETAPRFAKRASGFTRIINLARRRGDDAQMVIFELTEIKPKVKRAKKEKAKEAVTEEAGKAHLAASETRTAQENKPEAQETALKEKPPVIKKPSKKFLGGIRSIFKKERDSL